MAGVLEMLMKCPRHSVTLPMRLAQLASAVPTSFVQETLISELTCIVLLHDDATIVSRRKHTSKFRRFTDMYTSHIT